MLIVQKTIFDRFFKPKRNKIHTNPSLLRSRRDHLLYNTRQRLISRRSYGPCDLYSSCKMSFQNKDFWMSKAPGDIDNGDITHNNSSRTEPKRSQQWFMDGTEAEFFPNKKQAVEVPHPNSYTALLNSNISSWGNSSSFQSVSGFDETPTPRTTSFDGRKVAVDPFGIDSTFGLSISHPLVESRPDITYNGIRKVKVNQVKETEVFISDDEPITTGLSFDRTNDSMISMADTFRGDNDFMSMGAGTTEENNNISMDAFHEHSNTLLMDQVFNKDDGICNTLSIKNTNDISGLSMRHSFSKGGENNIISFGGINGDADNMNSSGRLVCSYDFLMGQPSVQRTDEMGLSESTSDAIVNGVQVTASGDAISKKKDQKGTKKPPPNNFPSNVRSLLSTGIMDGVSVKYVAWSREKELRGVIKGAAYLCGCQSCTFSKAINAYEFERHAGCKTKHPNNHIYFENGKTIYGVVQELRNTPQNMLFEVIQTITGSPINQKSFRLWKESFLAATRELQRIYGKEEGKLLS